MSHDSAINSYGVPVCAFLATAGLTRLGRFTWLRAVAAGSPAGLITALMMRNSFKGAPEVSALPQMTRVEESHVEVRAFPIAEKPGDLVANVRESRAKSIWGETKTTPREVAAAATDLGIAWGASIDLNELKLAVPHDVFAETVRIPSLKIDREKPVQNVCASGKNRSQVATNVMRESGEFVAGVELPFGGQSGGDPYAYMGGLVYADLDAMIQESQQRDHYVDPYTGETVPGDPYTEERFSDRMIDPVDYLPTEPEVASYTHPETGENVTWQRGLNVVAAHEDGGRFTKEDYQTIEGRQAARAWFDEQVYLPAIRDGRTFVIYHTRAAYSVVARLVEVARKHDADLSKVTVHVVNIDDFATDLNVHRDALENFKYTVRKMAGLEVLPR